MSAVGSPLTLESPVEFVPGVGPERGRLMLRMGIRRAADLVFLFPRNYEQPAPSLAHEDFEDKTAASFECTVREIDERVTQSGKHMLGVCVEPDSGGSVRLLWFNQAFRRADLRPGRRLLASGVLRSTGLYWEMIQPKVVYLTEDDTQIELRPLPIYPLTEGIQQRQMRSVMRLGLPKLIPLVIEVLPQDLRQRMDVLGISRALEHIHFPANMEEIAAAKRRFKLQELLVLQLAITLNRRRRNQGAIAPICEATGKIHARILNRLGLALTGDQLAAVKAIGEDMGRETPMNRLLQGDVGSGKTLVAQYAMLLCVAHGYQAALMVPTEVLAEQHTKTMKRSLSASRVRIEMLTGSLRKSARNAVLAKISDGTVDLVVGTQALLSKEIEFSKLGLVIVDEQHKFGVLQRAKLRVDGAQPHYLVLSATPIPRTIAMTEFGDLDVSTIREKPPGRSVVHTYAANREDLASWWRFVEEKLQSGRQAMVVVPRIASQVVGAVDPAADDDFEGQESTCQMSGIEDEPTDLALGLGGTENDNTGAATAEGIFRQLQEEIFSNWKVGLLHGRLPGDEKIRVLNAFAAGEIDLLVATTVVEVGIDIPNATVMTILDADRLGLAQLHQLRGRVSRGVHPGYVCGVASAGASAADNERLNAFEKSNDGFALAELDLKMRGPGNLLGTHQSGLPPMKIADLTEDAELLMEARQVAKELLEQDPELAAEELAKLKKQTMHRYGKRLQLSDVG